jgi:hypothetical protein
VLEDKDGKLYAVEDDFSRRTPKTINRMKVVGSVAAKNPNDAIDWIAGGGLYG